MTTMLLLLPKWWRALTKIELGIFVSLLVFSIAVAPYSRVPWEGAGWIAKVTFVLSGIALAMLLSGPVARLAGKRVASLPNRLTIGSILSFGILLQLCVAAGTHPQLTSDPAVYMYLAEKLANGEPYIDNSGFLAHWPPGLPLYLAPFVAVFGAGFYALLLANIGLYVIGCYATWQLGKSLSGASTGLLASILFSLWPSRLLSSGLASKENLTVAMLIAGTALCVKAFKAPDRNAWAWSIAAGIAYGIAGLAQPGLLLFAATVPIAYRYAYRQLGPRRYLLRSALVIIFTVLCLLPWQVRNCIIFKQEFCGIATNGGSVFYRANNPVATGSFLAQGEVSLKSLSELDQNRIGFELGKKWIREHPTGFAQLAVKKLIILLQDDNYGAYWGILRGEGKNDADSYSEGTSARILTFEIAEWISWLFWVLVVSWSARSYLFRRRRMEFSEQEKLLPLVYPMLYCAVIFSVFESGTRQHMIALAALIVLAAASIMREHHAAPS